MSEAYIFAGMPGAGKSHGAEILETVSDGTRITGGNVIREMASNQGLENPSSDELGQFASDLRDERGDGFFGDVVIEMFENGAFSGSEPYIIDSVRHENGYRTLAEYFDEEYLIWVNAGFETRYERVTDRGRDDESDFTREDLSDRDRHELMNLGTETIVINLSPDFFIQNEGSEAEFRAKLETVYNQGRVPDEGMITGPQ